MIGLYCVVMLISIDERRRIWTWGAYPTQDEATKQMLLLEQLYPESSCHVSALYNLDDQGE